MTKHEDIDHTGLTGVGGGGGAGLTPYATQPGQSFAISGNFGLANRAQMYHYALAAPMKLRGLRVQTNGAGSGLHEWGLFRADDATAAVKVAGGSAALAGGGWETIPAAGAPVDVPAGSYILIFKWPAANVSTIYYTNISIAGGTQAPFARTHAPTYTWDDTPDLTAVGWVDDATALHLVLMGDMDGSGRQW